MKLAELFKTLATRAGVAESDAKLTAVMAAIPDFDVDDDTVANPITKNLITETEAESRPKIKSKFTAEALNGIDALLDPALGDFFDATELDAIKADKTTSKKLNKLIEKAKALKTAGGSQGDVQKTIQDLNEQISKLKTDSETTVNSLKSQHKRDRYFDKLAAKVISRNDVTDYAKGKEGRRVITDLEDTLETVGGTLDIETGKIMQKGDNNLQLYIDNKPVTIDTILEKTLTDNEYLKKSEPAPTNSIQTPGGGNPGDQQTNAAQQRMASKFGPAK